MQFARSWRRAFHAIHWREIRSICGTALTEWSKHKAPRLGAALSFYTLLSIAPLLLVVVWVVALILGREAAQTNVVQQVEYLVGAQGAEAAKSLLQVSQKPSEGIAATIFGLATLLFGASGVMIELRDALNIIWDVSTPELTGVKEVWGFLKERLFSFAIVLAIGFVLLVSLALSAVISALGALPVGVLPAREILLHVLNSVVSFGVVTALFSAIYKFLPDTRIEWRDVVLGAAVTALLFTLGKQALGIYLGRASFASMYGAAGTIAVFIIWVYYSAQIFFFGAEFTKIFAHSHGSRNPIVPASGVVASRPKTSTILS